MRSLSTHTQHVSRIRWIFLAVFAIFAQAAVAFALRYEDERTRFRAPVQATPSSDSCESGEGCNLRDVVRGKWSIA